jgi:hypothetical protein
VLVLGWYTHEYYTDPESHEIVTEVRGHDRPSVLLDRDTTGFAETLSMFDAQVKTYQDDAERSPGLWVYRP